MTDATLWTNTNERYGAVEKLFHWTLAVAIITMIPLGIVANRIAHSEGVLTGADAGAVAQAAFLFSIHKTLGVLIFIVALARVLWSLATPRPAPLHPDRRVETWLAKTVHLLLYGSLILVPLTGWITHSAASGFAPIWWPFGQDLPLVPESPRVEHVAASLHILFERVLAVALVLHVAGALKHRFVDRDATLQRMTPGQPAVPPLPPHRRSWAAPAAALAVWALALGAGAALGLYRTEGAVASAPALETVASDWTVTEGTLALTVTNFGNEVEGSFGDWQAAIAYDEGTGTGDVTVTIATGSVTLGGVTDQARGPDFFDVPGFPTATFAAGIAPAAAGEALPDGTPATHVADGTLTLRGAEVPVALPVLLEVSDGTARMRGAVTVDRRDFAIGAGYEDEATVGFPVVIAVELTAERTE
ncbi:cytochrome b561 [Hasllibacter halocynthiae]|uniref:Cytochrome b561 n=1 Tax=Hasllibacter halocynthiae TaxID=595589 RepID=A0A2T0X8X9_9RHOB|nr:cytochrome b/b6 domain-containing protein [Hasllibacter halocynthiae]PRY95379.1 cytochrome b561 [Hasllibacter halocynthiae]